jgi:hypothetical protein
MSGSQLKQLKLSSYVTKSSRHVTNPPPVIDSPMKRRRVDHKLHTNKYQQPYSRQPQHNNDHPQYQKRRDNGSVAENGRKLDIILDQIASFQTNLSKLESRVDDDFNKHELRINALEQKSLNAQMEITGLDSNDVPANKMRDAVIVFFNELNIKIDERDLYDVYKITRRSKDILLSVIIVKFSSEYVKRRIIKEKIESDKKIGTPSVYFSDVLTKYNRKVLMEARQLKKKGIIVNAWSMHGEIFISPHHDANKIKIMSLSHLHDLCENLNVDVSEESEYEMTPRRSDNEMKAQRPHHNKHQVALKPKLTTRAPPFKPQNSAVKLSQPSSSGYQNNTSNSRRCLRQLNENQAAAYHESPTHESTSNSHSENNLHELPTPTHSENPNTVERAKTYFINASSPSMMESQ